jgi:hypothetical protein
VCLLIILRIQFTALGAATLPLQCVWHNTLSILAQSWVDSKSGPYPLGTVGAISYRYYESCNMTSPETTPDGSLIIPATSVNQYQLAPKELAEPIPAGPSCTIASVQSAQLGWELSGFSTRTDFNHWWSGWNSLGFSLINLASGRIAVVPNNGDTAWLPFLPVSQPDKWYSCHQKQVGAIDCQYQIDMATGYFAINQTWYCDDKDPAAP